jgi:hypothetical protein
VQDETFKALTIHGNSGSTIEPQVGRHWKDYQVILAQETRIVAPRTAVEHDRVTRISKSMA